MVAAPARACPLPVSYPGDTAPKAQIAQWMANGASAAGLPGELPVMGALVASGLANLDHGDADAVGYFQMRLAIWNSGRYAGYPDHPELQLQWFIDQATTVRQMRIAAGGPDPAGSESTWGDWIADVLLPAAQYRGLYQLRLDDARQLIGPPCDVIQGPGAPGTQPPTADTVPPVARVSGHSSQRAVRRGAIIVTVSCPSEGCVASATATLSLPGAKRALHLTAKPRSLLAGHPGDLRLALSARLRAALRRALRAHRSIRAKIVVTVADGAGNRAVQRRVVRVIA